MDNHQVSIPCHRYLDSGSYIYIYIYMDPSFIHSYETVKKSHRILPKSVQNV
jgi:hypothetical protein